MLPRVVAVLLLTSVNLRAAAVAPLVDPFDFEDVFFESDQSSTSVVLNAPQVHYLQYVAEVLTRHPKLRVAIVGNADTTEGSLAERQAASEARALTVYNWLSAHGLGLQVTEHKGVGSSDPIDQSDTEKQRRHNRRVDIIVVP